MSTNDSMSANEDGFAPNTLDIFGEEITNDTPSNPEDNQDSPEGNEFSNEKNERTIDPQDPEGKRYNYWQSEATKTKRQLELMEQQLQLVTPYLPIIKQIQENPDVIKNITSLGNPQQEELKKPVPPTKPERFDKVEAREDPESESYKYLEALEDFKVKSSEYLLNRIEQQEARQQKLIEEQTANEQRSRASIEVANTLISQHGMTKAEVHDFMQTYENPNFLTMERLVKLYRIEKGKTIPGNTQKNQNQNRNAPLPAGISGGQIDATISDDDAFTNSLVSSSNNRSVLWKKK